MDRINLMHTAWDEFQSQADARADDLNTIQSICRPCASTAHAVAVMAQYVKAIQEALLDGAPFLASSLLRSAIVFARVNADRLPDRAPVRLLEVSRALDYVNMLLDKHPEASRRASFENRLYRLCAGGHSRLMLDPDSVSRAEMQTFFPRVIEMQKEST